MVQNFNAILKSKTQLTETIFEFKYSVPENFTFIPGEFVSIKVGGNVRRSYTILEVQDGLMTLIIDVCPGGAGSLYFQNLKVNDESSILGPLGLFRCQETNFDKVFIATGTGIVPFVPMIKDLKQKGFGMANNCITVYFGARFFKDDIAYKYLKNLDKEDFIQYITCLTREESNEREYKKGRVSQIVPSEDHDWLNTEFYLCGNREMIEEMQMILRGKGAEKIYFEKY
jgi:all-trans-retinol 13,14-reductase